MAVIFSDNFNRANGDPGTNWTIQTGTTTKLQISSNKIDDNGTPTGSIMKCNTQATNADYYIQVDLTNNGASSVDNYIFGRYNGTDPWANNANCDMYWFVVHSNGSWALTSRLQGSDVTIASGGAGSITDLSNPHTFKLSMNGTSIAVYRDGSLLGSGTDSRVTAKGYAAIAGGYTPTPSITFDNFEIGDFATNHTKSLSDTITLSDSLSRVWVAIRSLSDTITLSDAISKSPGKDFTETAITMSDTIQKAFTKAVLDTVTLTDSISRALTKTFTEASITITDTMSKVKGMYISFTETITMSDMIWWKFVRGTASWVKQTLSSVSWSKQTPTSSTWTKDRGN